MIRKELKAYMYKKIKNGCTHQKKVYRKEE